MPLRALIVDDEPLAREGLRELLAEDADISAISEARDGREAVQAIYEASPDLVFLDVQMPEMDGLAVVREVGADRMPPVVFVTAHDAYAIRAFEINAIDYLLKPVTRKRFNEALLRAKVRLHSQTGIEKQRQILSLLEGMAPPRRHVSRVAVRSGGKTYFVDVADVDWIKAAENYVELHAGSKTHLVHVTLNTLEQSLNPEIYLRIHRGLIVNINRIKELQPASHGEYVVTLYNGVQLQSGRAYSDKLKNLTQNPF